MCTVRASELSMPPKLAAFYRYANGQLHATAFGGAPSANQKYKQSEPHQTTKTPPYPTRKWKKTKTKTKQNKKRDWWLIMALELYTTRGYWDFGVATIVHGERCVCKGFSLFFEFRKLCNALATLALALHFARLRDWETGNVFGVWTDPKLGDDITRPRRAGIFIGAHHCVLMCTLIQSDQIDTTSRLCKFWPSHLSQSCFRLCWRATTTRERGPW